MSSIRKLILILLLSIVVNAIGLNYSFATSIQRSDFSNTARTEGFDTVPLLSPIPNYPDFDVVGIGGTPTAVNNTVPGLVGDFNPVSPPNVIGMDGQGITNGKSLKFVFHEEVFQVGAQLIDVEEPGATFSAYDKDGQLLENLPITPQGTSGLSKFYGIQHSGIRSVIIATSSSEGIGVDDLTYTIAARPFDAFTAGVRIKLGPLVKDDEFHVKASFTLGADSNGISPLTEDMNLQVGSLSMKIPAGSFKQDKQGRIKFNGVVSDVHLEVVILQLDTMIFELKIEGEGADLNGTVMPVAIGLNIGDDGGIVNVIGDFRSNP